MKGSQEALGVLTPHLRIAALEVIQKLCVKRLIQRQSQSSHSQRPNNQTVYCSVQKAVAQRAN